MIFLRKKRETMRVNVVDMRPGDVFRFPWPSDMHVWLGDRWVLTDGCVWCSAAPSVQRVVLLIEGEQE